jgi:muramoyltetrapeptide carboxypeptidase
MPKRTQADRALCQQYAAKPLSIKASSLWGGNLSVLTSLIGTPYLPEVQGGVLWFEDTGESPFRIERMLTQWLNAGILTQQKAIVLGQFTESKLYPHDRGFNMAGVVARLRSQLKIPVLTGLPFGHVPTKVMLPFGAPVRLLCDGSDAMLLWDEL